MLFPSHWDRRYLGSGALPYEVTFHGEGLWSFPRGFVRMLHFDPLRFIDETARRCARERIDGVFSTDEYVGVAVAAAVAARLGLPGPDPSLVIESQHKLHARALERQVAPEHVPRCVAMTVPPPRIDDLALPFPMFVKPARGSFSIFAARVDSYPALQRHLGLSAPWRFGLRSVLRPYNRLLAAYRGPSACDANRFVAEELLAGDQFCIDGWAQGGDVQVLGVVDELLYPGTCAFERFQYPSRAAEPLRRRMIALAVRLVRGLGLRDTLFNVELIHDPATDRLQILELHPRMSYQFADLYRDVDTIDPYRVALAIAAGETPRAIASAGPHRLSASMVIRKFSGSSVRRLPPREMIDAFRSRHPQAQVHVYAKKGSMNPEMRAMGSYRCALVNAGADSTESLHDIRADADRMLPFEVA